MEFYGVVSKRAGEEDDLRKSPKMVDGCCSPPGLFFLWLVKLDLGLPCGGPGAQQSHSRPRQLLLLRDSRTHLRKCLTSSDLTLSPPPPGTRSPLPSRSAPAGCPGTPGFQLRYLFPFVPASLSDASRRASQEQSSGAGICGTRGATGLLLLVLSFGRWLLLPRRFRGL